MKNLHLCISLILFLSPTSVFAQFFERSLQPIIHNYTLNLNAIRSDSILYWQTEYNNLSFRTVQMHRVDYDGNITTTTVFRSGVPTLQIIDLNGRTLAQKYVMDNQLTLPAEQWPPGLYQVLVRTDEGQWFLGKLIKM